MPFYLLQQRADPIRRDQRRCTAAKKHRVNRSRIARSLPNQSNFMPQGIQVRRNKLLLPGICVKITVVAAMSAKRNVKVDT